MSIPTKEEAQEIARLNMEMDADKHFRKIESLLMIWDGVSTITINDLEYGMATYIAEELKKKGFEANPYKQSGTSLKWKVTFK